MIRPAMLVAALVMLAARPAWSKPVLTLQTQTGTATLLSPLVRVTDGAPNDSALEDTGVVTYIGRVGSWGINITTGASGVGGTGVPELDLSSLDYTSTGPGTLIITLTDTITGPWTGTGAIASVGGTFNATGLSSADFKTLIDNQLISELSFSSKTGPAFSGSDPFEFKPGQNDTIQLIATITHSGKGSTSFDYAVSPVPEPGTVLLFGAGVFGLAVFGKRRRNR